MRKYRSFILQCVPLFICMLMMAPGFAQGDDQCDETLKPGNYGDQDLQAKGKTLCVGPGTYVYRNVNIYGDGNQEGKLIFQDAGGIDFWAKSILVENKGSLIAGSPDQPIGSKDIMNVVTFHLYGGDAGPGITCNTTKGRDPKVPDFVCGVPSTPDNNKWDNDHKTKYDLPGPGGANDYFYKYANLPTYEDQTDGDYYFGRKVLAVSFGGTLRMFGKKGATYIDPAREAYVNVKKGDVQMSISKFVDWRPGDRIMLLSPVRPLDASGLYTIKGIDAKLEENKTIVTIDAPGVTHTDEKGGKFLVVPMDPYGTSWVRLNKSLKKDDRTLTLNRAVDWQVGDQIVVTATDYLPFHSETLTIQNIDSTRTIITTAEKILYPHNGEKYALEDKHNVPKRLKDDGFAIKEVDTRAAVALLSRNIRVVSESCETYDAQACQGMPEKEGVHFGGHTIVRQGVKQYQIQGVEFRQLGQGGRMAHSPINFHLVRQAPPDTFVRDCSVNESMTRWFELRGTQNVLLERNVGYKSIGHGYYLAEGTEVNNMLRANIGILARAAVGYYDQSGKFSGFTINPRMVPGVLGKTNTISVNYLNNHKYCKDIGETMQFASDYIHPTLFHIMNGYNNFEYNMAVGAGTCGSCYWIVPSNASGLSLKQVWEGYANIQKIRPVDGLAPLKSFKGNFCSTAMHSLVTVGNTGNCGGVSTCSAESNPDWSLNEDVYKMIPIRNRYDALYENANLYPNAHTTSFLKPTRCAKGTEGCLDSEKTPFKFCTKGQTEDCVVSVIDSYTSSFHWANTNFGAIWLRSNWFLVTDSALTDVVNGGLTAVSGGSYDQVINGYWALTRRSVFIGHTQQWDMKNAIDDPVGNAFATNAGPFNKYSGLQCEDILDPIDKHHLVPAAICLSRSQGISMPTDNFSNNQRLYNIYDGPVYQQSNVFAHIKKTPVNCSGGANGLCSKSQYMYGGDLNRGMGIPKAKEDPYNSKCVLPNAAIGWKQPNGFYYPPAFHSRNIYFNDVDLRHFVIVPLFQPGTTNVDTGKVEAQYCTYPGGNVGSLFAGTFTDVDRQTELNDDDGSVSGLAGATPLQIRSDLAPYGGTISVNNDEFFKVPTQTLECLSEQTCFQVPYDYVTAVVYPNTVKKKGDMTTMAYCSQKNIWCDDCQDRDCYGLPIYRQFLRPDEKKGLEQSIRMMGAGIFQRSTMLVNKGAYYLDTAVSEDAQRKQGQWKINAFQGGQSYNFFLIFAKPETRVTFQLYVGAGLNVDKDVVLVRAGSEGTDQVDGKNVVVLTADFGKTSPINFTPGDWPAKWIKKYDDKGILTVTMDLGDPAITPDFTAAMQESCKPSTFCVWQPDSQDRTKGKCVYNKGQNIIDYKGDDAICQWSVKAQECPRGGCLGFQVKFPDAFAADDQAHRPDPVFFTEAGNYYKSLGYNTGWDYASDWKVDWKLADSDYAGSCVYAKPPDDSNGKAGMSKKQ